VEQRRPRFLHVLVLEKRQPQIHYKKRPNLRLAKTLDKYKKAFPTKAEMGVLKFTLVETTQLGKDAVYVIGKWELEKEEPAGGHFTLLWRKIKDQWVIVSDHTN
jgi:ketosteroid isomerase-like protein